MGTTTVNVNDEWQRLTPATAGVLQCSLHGDVDGYCSYSPATPAADAYGHVISGEHLNVVQGDATLNVYVRARSGRSFKLSYEAA